MDQVKDCLFWAEKEISPISDIARLDAEWLMVHLLGLENRGSLLFYDKPLSDGQVEEFRSMVARRKTYEPVAHITGETEFWSLPFYVTADTLIPRADSETLVDHALNFLRGKESANILDLGTGSGCLILSILHECEGFTGVGLDQSAKALEIAQKNAVLNKVDDRVTFMESDWFSALEAFGYSESKFDLIISNPPYIPSEDCKGLMRDVQDFEPMTALDGGVDGMGPYRHIIECCPQWLKAGGMLAFECGIGQADDIVALFKKAQMVEIETIKDLPGVDRVVSAKMPKA